MPTTKEETIIDMSFIPKYKTLKEVISDQKLAALGDAYINFIYSLAQSQKRKTPSGTKVSNQVLARALRKAELRSFLPNRSDRHKQSNAAEALIVYAWIQKAITIAESICILQSKEEEVENFAALLHTTKSRLNL